MISPHHTETSLNQSPIKQTVSSTAIELEAPTLQVTRGLYEHWLHAKVDGEMPRYRDMRPGQLKELTPFVYILNILDNGADFSVRFMGSAITQSIGADYTNAKISDSASHPSAWRADVYREVMARKAPMVTAVDLGDFERDFTKTECILLPLANEAGQLAMIICAAEQY